MKKERWNACIRWALLAVLAGAAAVLWQMEGRVEQKPPVPATPAPTVQNDVRLKREASYERDAAALKALTENESADAATREMAAQTLTALVEEHQYELGLEAALQEAGYENAVVLVQNGAVTVMLGQDELNDEAGAQILELCVIHAGVGAENVRVMGLRQRLQ